MLEKIKSIILQQIDYPIDIDTLRVDPDRSLEEQLTEMVDHLKKVYADDQEIIHYIDRCNRMASCVKLCPMFDLDETTPANGYRSMVMIFIKGGKMLAAPVVRASVDREHLVNIFTVLEEGLKVCYDLHARLILDQNVDLGPRPNLFSSHMDLVSLLDIFQSLRTQLVSLNEYFPSFWLGSMARVLRLFTIYMAIFSTQWKTFKPYNYFSRKVRARMFTNMTMNINVDCLQCMWNITDWTLIRFFLSSWRRFWIHSAIDIHCPRQHRWKIDSYKPVVHDMQCPPTNAHYPVIKRETVRCLFLRNHLENKTNSLLLHIHGGGFISQSPESHEVYLIEWLKKLENIPILSIDYTLSPEARFPEALQEILDVYLWLLSKDPKVKETLGFYPERIAFCGDSAGGNFSMAMMPILNDIQKQLQSKQQSVESYRFPDGLFLFYAPLILLTNAISPSRILSSVDSLVPLATLLNCLYAYVPEDVVNDPQPRLNGQAKADLANGKSLIAAFDTSTMLGYVWAYAMKYYEALGNVFPLKLSYRSKPWFKQTDDLRARLERMNQFLSNPFCSPLLSSTIADYNHVPLYLNAAIYDSFLDDNVEIAKKWRQDKVILDPIDNMPHGYLNFIDFNAKAKQDSLRCIPHMIKILG